VTTPGGSWQIEVSSSARRQLRNLDAHVRRRIVAAIDDLAYDPRPSGAVKLTGEQDLWRIRVGNYRIVYSIEDKRLIVTLVRVAHRSEVYRRL
jgi:mRNA interferase RelE/StbE